MSLINQMLKDIDARQASLRPGAVRARRLVTGAAGPARRQDDWLLPLLAGAVVLLLAVIGWLLFTRSGIGAAAPVAAAPEPAPVVVARAAEPVTAPAAATRAAEPAPAPAAATRVAEPLPTPAPATPPVAVAAAPAAPVRPTAAPEGAPRAEPPPPPVMTPPDPPAPPVGPVAAAPQPVPAPAPAGKATAAVPATKAATAPPPAPAKPPRQATSVAFPSQGTSMMEKTSREPTSAQRAEAVYQEGYGSLLKGRAGEAERLFRDALSADSRHRSAREGLAGLLASAGRWADLRKVVTEGLATDPGHGALAQVGARAALEQGEPDTAVAWLERAAASASQEADFHALLAATYQQAGRFTESATLYQRLLMANPQQATWWVGFAVALDSLGRTAEAREAFRNALARNGLTAQLQAYARERLGALD